MGWDLGRAWRAWIVIGIASILAACESPTLPLPPPDLPGISKEASGEVKLTSRYGAAPNAIIVTYNLDPDVPLDKRVGGAQADAFGSWDATITASSMDEIDITQEVGAASSIPLTITIP
jgi:hypothetical protein